MNFPLPPPLSAGIESLLDGVSRKDLGVIAGKQSAAYRAGKSSAAVRAQGDVLAYLVARAPATYAAIRAVFARLAEAAPAFAPASLLDIGAGPGTASWAAGDAWPSLVSVTMLEPNPAFRAVAARLLPQAAIIAAELGAAKPKADLVVAAYVLAELPEQVAAAAALDLWSAAADMLVLVEPGTPAGFARLRAARAALIDAGAHVAAPCTHENVCPIRSVGESRSDQKTGNDWCHFSQRLARSRDHMILKDASVPFEDERYAYVAVGRAPVGRSAAARVIKPTVESKPGITLPLCTADGLRDAVVARRDKEAFRPARKLGWGDLF